MTKLTLFTKNDGKMTYNATVRAGSEEGAVIAHATYRKLKDEGELTLVDPSKKYTVEHTFASGRWELRLVTESSEVPPAMISAHKPKAFSRRLVLTMGNDTFEMIAKSKIRSHFVVCRLNSPGDAQEESEQGGEAHDGKGKEMVTLDKKKFRNQYTVTYDEGVPVELPLFCYWMINLYQRQETEQAAAAGAY